MFVQLCSFQLSPMFKKYQHKKSLNECKILHSNLKNTSLQIAIHCNFMLFLASSSVHKNAVTRNFSGDWSKNWITHSSVILSLKREIDGDRRSRRRKERRGASRQIALPVFRETLSSGLGSRRHVIFSFSCVLTIPVTRCLTSTKTSSWTSRMSFWGQSAARSKAERM